MSDMSELDLKYFIDDYVYNCPFCKRRNVRYKLKEHHSFNWSSERECILYLVQCLSCNNISLHFTNEVIHIWRDKGDGYSKELCFNGLLDIDDYIFYSVPTSLFVLDNRIPRLIRELISEAEGCLKMNYLTGASACTRKSIYELLLDTKAVGVNYEERIKSLKDKYPQLDPVHFDILSHIQNMTSEKVHEQSWLKWDSRHLLLILETLKSILEEIYVIPEERSKRSKMILELRKEIGDSKKVEEKGENE